MSSSVLLYVMICCGLALNMEDVVSLDELHLERCQTHGDYWTDELMLEEIKAVLSKLETANMHMDPFPHISIHNFLSDCLYQDLMNELPDISAYKKLNYAGSYDTKELIFLEKCAKMKEEDSDARRTQIPADVASVGENCHTATADHPNAVCCAYQAEVRMHPVEVQSGNVLFSDDESFAQDYPLWSNIYRLVHSNNFTHTLVNRFIHTSGGIPEWKKSILLKNGALTPLQNSAALRIEPSYYHLSPHIDLWQKAVTWQYFHPPSNELKDKGVGTFLYKLKGDYSHIFVSDYDNPTWFPYHFFDVVKELKASKNHFYAFAPNNRSFHGAAIDPSKMNKVNDKHSRRTFLGFITAKEWNYHHFTEKDTAEGQCFDI